MTPLFWLLVILAGFAFALAVQIRLLISYALRQALAAKFGGERGDPAYRMAVAGAGRAAPESEAARHIAATYPGQVRQLALARRVTLIAPALLLALLLAGRFLLGAV
jgi:hypothetical protein